MLLKILKKGELMLIGAALNLIFDIFSDEAYDKILD
jgi:hypothetical protein